MTVKISSKNLIIPKKMEKEVNRFSRNLGVSEKEILINAVKYYLDLLKNNNKLNKELETWEKASNEDLLKFEKNI